MAETATNTNTVNTDTSQQTAAQAGTEGENNSSQNNSTSTADEKKYSEEEMNGISKKNSEKAVNKLLKELGITDKAKAKDILQKAAEKEAKEKGEPDNGTAELQNELAAERSRSEHALLEVVLLQNGVDASRVSKASRLVELKDCRDEDGSFDREKANTAVQELLKEWPELKPKEDEGKKGFSIGSDGQQDSGNNAGSQKAKALPQKSWNRFN